MNWNQQERSATSFRPVRSHQAAVADWLLLLLALLCAAVLVMAPARDAHDANQTQVVAQPALKASR